MVLGLARTEVSTTYVDSLPLANAGLNVASVGSDCILPSVAFQYVRQL